MWILGGSFGVRWKCVEVIVRVIIQDTCTAENEILMYSTFAFRCVGVSVSVWVGDRASALKFLSPSPSIFKKIYAYTSFDVCLSYS